MQLWKMEREWRELVEEVEDWYSNRERWKEEETEQKSWEEMKGCGCDSDSNAVFEIIDAPASLWLL